MVCGVIILLLLCKSLTFYSIEPPRLVYRKTLVKYNTRYINAVFNLLKNICLFAPHNLKNRISKSELWCESAETRGNIMIKNQNIFRTNI